MGMGLNFLRGICVDWEREGCEVYFCVIWDYSFFFEGDRYVIFRSFNILSILNCLLIF